MIILINYILGFDFLPNLYHNILPNVHVVWFSVLEQTMSLLLLLTHCFYSKELLKTLETEQQSQKDCDVFLMFLFSYGNSREIFTKDGQPFKIDNIFDMFDGEKCPKLKGKPKLFIIQTFERDDGSDSPCLDADGKLSVNFTLKDDMTVVYTTVKGKQSKRST